MIIDWVVSAASNAILVMNADRFVSGQKLDIWTPVKDTTCPGDCLGSVVVETIDKLYSVVWTVGKVPADTIPGCVLLAPGA